MPSFVALLVLSGLLNASYFLPIIWQAFFDVDRKQPKTFSLDTIPFPMKASLVVLALMVVYFGIQPEVPLNLARMAAGLFLQ
jgi:NADH:ubiquinone oxidoreductase subunit 2 (subunit N)